MTSVTSEVILYLIKNVPIFLYKVCFHLKIILLRLYLKKYIYRKKVNFEILHSAINLLLNVSIH